MKRKEKLHLKEGVKTVMILFTCLVFTIAFIEIASKRIEAIESNPEAYKTRSIMINFTR